MSVDASSVGVASASTVDTVVTVWRRVAPD